MEFYQQWSPDGYLLYAGGDLLKKKKQESFWNVLFVKVN